MSVGVSNSQNQPALYVTRGPDWSQAVELEAVHATLIYNARSGKEQRSRSRAWPKARITYNQRGLSTAESRQAAARAAGEVRSPLWVPFWPCGAIVVGVPAAGQVTLNVPPSPDWFAVGQKLYVVGEFRDIVSVSDLTLTLDTAPATSPLNSRAYPARVCKRIMGADTLDRTSGRTHSEQLVYETID